MKRCIFLIMFLFSLTGMAFSQDTVIQAPAKIIITKIEIKSYPGLDSKGNPWDVATIHPDILLQIYKGSVKIYSSKTLKNVEIPPVVIPCYIYLDSPAQAYEIRLIDDDTDAIAGWQPMATYVFQPFMGEHYITRTFKEGDLEIEITVEFRY